MVSAQSPRGNNDPSERRILRSDCSPPALFWALKRSSMGRLFLRGRVVRSMLHWRDDGGRAVATYRSATH